MSSGDQPIDRVGRLEVGIPGFDEVAGGGIPAARSTLIAGTAGSGKTMFSIQFLLEGAIRYGQGGVLVTFDEAPAEMIRNVGNLGWDLRSLIAADRLAVIDISNAVDEEVVEAGEFDFRALLARLETAVRRTSAKRVVFDSLTGIFPQFTDRNIVRRELHRVTGGLREMGVTTLMTAERTEEYGPVARYGVEEFVADNVIILRNPLQRERRRRTIEILKFRGAAHHKGEYPFSIDHRSGVNVIPLAEVELKRRALGERVSLGNADIDEMCGGGVFRDSIVLVSGATGAGKTMMATEFVKAGAERGERGLYLSFEESRAQILRNAGSWGVDFEAAEADGLLRIHTRFPERMGLEDLLVEMRHQIQDFQPRRIAIDSLSVLDRVASGTSFREFVVGLTSLIKEFELVALCTNTTAVHPGVDGPSMTHISTITDTIILLRYVEIDGEIRRCLTVLKMRGSRHDKTIREYTIGDTGMDVSGRLTTSAGIVGGLPAHIPLQ